MIRCRGGGGEEQLPSKTLKAIAVKARNGSTPVGDKRGIIHADFRLKSGPSMFSIYFRLSFMPADGLPPMLNRKNNARAAAALALTALAAWIPATVLGQDAFRQCVARLESRAVADGVDAGTAKRVLARTSKLQRVIAADRNQPEFVETFRTYLDRRVTDERVAAGRRLFAKYRDRLRELTRKYGVPGQYLVALWGMETNYGQVLGNVPVFDSLTTLACDDRRSEYFTTELVNALQIVDRDGVDAGEMTGSWAGAMGQTQFMPSAYLHFAVDGDGDSKIDLWHSVGDAFASAANYLSQLNWQPGLRWGREVVLPQGFDYSLAGLERGRTLSEWRKLGVKDIRGNPVADMQLNASVLLPAGHEGPAFVVYDNFRAILRWNRSEFYALAVGHLADRIAGGGRLHRLPPKAQALSREQLMRVQSRLNAFGDDSGKPDGIPGPATRAAVRAFQSDHGMVADGYIDGDLLRSLGLK